MDKVYVDRLCDLTRPSRFIYVEYTSVHRLYDYTFFILL